MEISIIYTLINFHFRLILRHPYYLTYSNWILLLFTACAYGEFSCDLNRCIPVQQRCDGVKDCDDGTDELHCKKDEEQGKCKRSFFTFCREYLRLYRPLWEIFTFGGKLRCFASSANKTYSNTSTRIISERCALVKSS